MRQCLSAKSHLFMEIIPIPIPIPIIQPYAHYTDIKNAAYIASLRGLFCSILTLCFYLNNVTYIYFTVTSVLHWSPEARTNHSSNALVSSSFASLNHVNKEHPNAVIVDMFVWWGKWCLFVLCTRSDMEVMTKGIDQLVISSAFNNQNWSNLYCALTCSLLPIIWLAAP